MTVFRHVARLNVSLWGKRVGTIVESPQRGVFAFRYDKGFLKSGIEISPLMMPLRAEPYVFGDLPRAAYEGLPPIFADSLPDTFGTGLIDHWLTEHGLSRDAITPLDFRTAQRKFDIIRVEAGSARPGKLQHPQATAFDTS